jgi:adenylate cyclase
MTATIAELDCLPRAPAQGRRRLHAARARAAASRLAVFPFDNLTADDRGSSIADALTVLVVANLACRDAVDVVSHASTLQFRGAHVALADIAREQGAGHIVQGAILRVGQEMQVLLQLVDAHSGEVLLMRTYTGQPSTMQRIQTAIASQIADELVDSTSAA